MKKLNLVILFLLFCLGAIWCQDDVSLKIAFMTHLDMNLPEQDVYVEKEPGSNEVWRVTKGFHNMKAELYKTATATPHDPFNPDALGPFPKGEPIGMTLGEWLKHRGTGNYTCNNGRGNLDMEFTGIGPQWSLYNVALLYGPPSSSTFYGDA